MNHYQYNKIRRHLAGMILYLLFSHTLWATHNRAGEITYRLISGFTYEITINTFTYTLSAADRPQLEVQWGDNTKSIAPRVGKVVLPNFYFHNTYIVQHTFPGPGVYEIVVQDPNRNYGVKNIPNSVNVIFSIKTKLVISPLTGGASAPVLLNPPIDKAAKGRLFIHNPGAFDMEGDSLSYELTVCTEENGKPIAGYAFPAASDTFYVNPITGDLVWDSPVDTGIYNVAMKVNKWRNNVLIGSVTRDMQINVYNSTNHPPVNPPLHDYCVLAGNEVSFDLTSTDPDGDKLFVRASGGPFEMPTGKATFDSVEADTGYSTYHFQWLTNCTHVRQRPYLVTIKATDLNKQLQLNDFDVFNIRVIGPPPQALSAHASANAIRLTWNRHPCSNVKFFEIYRSNGPSGYAPDSCETGIPSYSSFRKIGQTALGTDTLFVDDGSTDELIKGIQYCYRIVAVFNDSYSVASDEVCASLVPGLPALINASVTNIDPAAGSAFLAWLRPNPDSLTETGPYKLVIYRSPDLWGSSFQPIDSIFTATLDDTTYIDQPLNTIHFPYSYKVELYNNVPGNTYLIGTPEVASTLYPQLKGIDNKIEINAIRNVPWINTAYVFYRFNPNSGLYDSIGISNTNRFIDTDLTNGKEYCYRIKSMGFRDIENRQVVTTNFSHKDCATPVDSISPCPPDLNVTNMCDSAYNFLQWTNPNHFCADDVVSYKIYYSPVFGNTPEFLTAISSQDTTYRHYPDANLAGCYQVTAVDSFENESKRSVLVCVDACSFYELPNVFTPNGDGINDIYIAKNKYHYVQKVDMKIYNRWGSLVFQTSDPDINWDGRSIQKGKIVPSGVYYYVCDVYEPRLTGLEVRNLVGFIHVYSNEKNTKPQDK